MKNAEEYYRAMYYGSHKSWNLRDRHMFETLQALLRRQDRGSRAVVWAHNSHLGNAAATAMSARGETHVGELCRNEFGDSCYAVGFGTDHGTVAAADDWDGPMRIMDVRPAHEGSYERICHDAELPRFSLPLRERDMGEVRDVLMPEWLERARSASSIGRKPSSQVTIFICRHKSPNTFAESDEGSRARR